MNKYLLFILFFLTVVYSTSCTEGQVFAKVTKKCAAWAKEESYLIYKGEQLLFTSPTFSNAEQRTINYCLDSSTNDQYTLVLKDSGGDSWSAGSWLKIEGLYGNVIFKAFMTERSEEAFTISLHYAIMKGQEWKVEYGQSNIPTDWTKTSFSDSDWTSVNLAAPSETTSGTQYFRKTFTGLADMAAYELQMNYKYGIIAYINGNEIFRDNMPVGSATPATEATGSYQDISYHGIIRPASEVAITSSILAVELHYTADTSQTTIDFDAYLAIYASTVPEDNCYIYGYDVTLSSSQSYNIQRAFNFHKQDYYMIRSELLPGTLNFQFTHARPYINSIRIWPYTKMNSVPGSFKWQGTMGSTSSGEWNDIITVTSTSYNTETFNTFSGFFNANIYKSYRLTNVRPVHTGHLYMYEVQPVVCATSIPTSIEYEKESYSFYAKYESIMIQPKITEFTSCTVQPALPTGLTLNANTCIISGMAQTSLSSTTYTVTSITNGQTFTGTFTLGITECSGTYIKILRTYKIYGHFESFSIKDTTTQDVVLQVAQDGDQPSNQDVSTFLCLTGNKYTITMGGSHDYWQSKSFLYIHVMLSDTEYETALRACFDDNLGLPSVITFNAKLSISPISQWYYKMGEVPANWYNSETSGWQQSLYGSFPESSNQIQLYKHTFNVDSTANLAGFVISLRYKYGCIIYLNGHEAFRNGVTGDLSTSSLADNSYSDVKYRKISLPIKTIAVDDTAAVEYIKQGSNTIAIALVAINANQKTSVFDCALRIMGDEAISRLFDFSIKSTGILGSANDIGYHHYSFSVYSNSCNNNHWTITFDDDRREWISSVSVFLYYTQNDKQPKNFTLKARNSNSDEWTTIKEVNNMTWSLMGQHKKLWLDNNQPYNQYRFENINSGETEKCYWKVGSFDITSESTVVTIPDLTYPATIEVYKDIEMGEVYSNSDYFFDFEVTPELPASISIDPNDGTISGTATAIAETKTYTITAKKFGGGTSSTTFSLIVAICTGDKGLITLVARTDGNPEDSAYKLYQGRGTSGDVVASIEHFRAARSLNYGDFCVSHGIYTIEITTTSDDGWTTPAGYYLTVDLGTMVIETGQIATGVQSVSTSFSSCIPFQIEYDTWKLYNAEKAPAADWDAIDYDDSTWTPKKAAEFGNHIGTTAYIRYDVTIPDIADYYVLNVRVKYAGGIVAYFNGRKVARFNLADNYDDTTEADRVHDASLFSKFHVILSTVGAVTGKNVMAFEVHRNNAESTIIFDATGVFGVNDCSVVVDTFSEIEGKVSIAKEPAKLFDLMPHTYGYMPNTVGATMCWVIENLEGSKFNSFGFQSTTANSQYGFSLYARWSDSEDYVSALAIANADILEKKRNAWTVDVGLAGFREFRFEVDAVSKSNVYIADYIMQYCKPSGTSLCPAIDDYPSVGEGQVSPSYCPEGMRGYSYRECKNGQLGDIKSDKCIYKEPLKLFYDKQNFIFVKDTKISTGIPSYINIITKFYIQEDYTLPEGLSINEQTGEISGIPTTVMDEVTIIVRGSNPAGEVYTNITIAVRTGICASEGIFDTTEVGKTFVYDCAIQGTYIGTQKRACVLGEKDGEWQKPHGFCMPVVALVLTVLAVIIIIAIVILIILKSRKTKAVGGVKGKGKSPQTNKDLDKKTKDVKV